MIGSEKFHVPDGGTKERAEVKTDDLSEEGQLDGKYMGTDADRHDMMVLEKETSF